MEKPVIRNSLERLTEATAPHPTDTWKIGNTSLGDEFLRSMDIEEINNGVHVPFTVALTMDRVGTNTTNAQTVFVSIPQTITTAGGKTHVQSVIQQPQQSVIQSTALQTVQLSKAGNVYLLKHPSNSVIQSTGGNSLQAVQLLNAEALEEHVETSHKKQILARRPSYKKILNELTGGKSSCTHCPFHFDTQTILQLTEEKVEAGSSDSSQDDPSVSGTTTITLGGQQYQTAGLLKVIPASSLQLATGQGGESLQTIAMTNASTGNAIVHYAPGNSDGQLIVPVQTSDLSALKIATTVGGVSQGVVLATTATSAQIHNSNDSMAEEATRKREIRLMKNREAARECRAKKKEYIKCLENRVAVLENQNRTLIEELKTLKALYGLNDVKE